MQANRLNLTKATKYAWFPITVRKQIGDVVQLVRTLPCHGRGRGFESRRPRHSFQRRNGSQNLYRDSTHIQCTTWKRTQGTGELSCAARFASKPSPIVVSLWFGGYSGLTMGSSTK